MLVAVIRNQETVTVELQGESMQDLRRQLDAQCPPGFELTSAPVTAAKGSAGVITTATFMRRDQTREIEGENFEAIRALTPEGWVALHVRAI